MIPLYIVFALFHLTQTERSCPSNSTDCFGSCCPNSRKCCYDTRSSQPPGGGTCCPTESPNCWLNPADDPYGEHICYSDYQQPCWNRQLSTIFCNKTLGQTCCSDPGREEIPVACCNPGYSCCNGLTKSQCCSPGSTCCTRGDGCCPPGSTCCNDKGYTNLCCPDGTSCSFAYEGCCPLKSLCHTGQCCYGTSKPLCIPGGNLCYDPEIEFPCFNSYCLLNETCCSLDPLNIPTCLPPGKKCCPNCPDCLAGMCLVNTTIGITCTKNCTVVDVEKDFIIWELESRKERIT